MEQAQLTPDAKTQSLLTAWLPVLVFSLLWIDLVRLLSGNWEAREQYAYGWFVPFLALALLWRRWMDRPAPSAIHYPASSGGSHITHHASLALVVFSALLLLPLRVVFEINTDWPLIAWAYTAIAVGLTLYAFLLAGGWVWVRHFAFPICFILVALVWPNRIEKGLTQNLMQVVASLTVDLIGWFGVPAIQRGNLIEVTTGVVGVDEACSGIRSFQSTLMAALFLGELYRLSWPRRLSLLVGGVMLSFAFNVVRTLFLTWQASAHGIAAIDKWHDSAGMSIFLISFACLWGVAVLIQRKSSPSAPVTADDRLLATVPSSRRHQPASLPGGFLLAVGCWAVLCFVATEVWYRSHEVKDAGSFQWSAVAPEHKPGFQKIELPPRSLKLLAFDAGSTSRWNEDDGSEFSLFFFRWNPRSIQSVIQSRVHRPEVCLPASGFKQLAESELVSFDVGPLKLPFRKYTYEADGRALFVFFCQWEDGAEMQTGLGASGQTERLRTVWVGRRLVGQQTIEIIITGSPSLTEAEALVRRRLPELIRLEPAPVQPQQLSRQNR